MVFDTPHTLLGHAKSDGGNSKRESVIGKPKLHWRLLFAGLSVIWYFATCVSTVSGGLDLRQRLIFLPAWSQAQHGTGGTVRWETDRRRGWADLTASISCGIARGVFP
jgi:hypothetical protein